ncbi:hypothetical protein GOA63_16425 [Sinorhizobium meliloti]|uniref:hypothetical protein n=1 Tax=Rhizobium meliloti TaxID=382 RepID=UPI001297031D|nr:hypothetical protein [Sinorhizobium meliloti]MDW9593792.1 hypothetical protein [Sinorhizobium meliloti]MDX0188864.1 hypothetical protein [Sinorhizobium meliloti]MQV10082.1 hypothetical protein [Sinorhizobium meliloti]MQV59236.1 hypothetical protein [Sinorhizobium meliloti]
MKRFQAIEKAIQERWAGDPAAGMCCAILDYAVSKPDETSVMLTFGDFSKLTGASFDQEELQRAIAILVSRYSALEMRLIFFDEKDGPLYLDKEEQSDFVKTGTLAHPHSGEIVQDAKDRIFPYYIAQPQALLEEVRR